MQKQQGLSYRQKQLLCPSPKTALGQHDPAMPILCMAEWGRPATSTAPRAMAPPPDADALPWWVTGGWGPPHGGSDHHVTLQHEVIQGHTPSPPRSHIWALSHPYTVPGLPAGTPTGQGEEKLQPSLDVEVLHGVPHPHLCSSGSLGRLKWSELHQQPSPRIAALETPARPRAASQLSKHTRAWRCRRLGWAHRGARASGRVPGAGFPRKPLPLLSMAQALMPLLGSSQGLPSQEEWAWG